MGNAKTSFIDVRDIAAYQQGHLPGAQHLSKDNLVSFLQQTDKSRPVIVYCYHGISSQSVAKFLLEEDFVEVYSMIGGFAAWINCYPADQEVSHD
jgi:thiosulfate sulfurtransferase